MKSLSRFLLFLFLVLVVLAGFIFTLKNSNPVALWLLVDFSPRPLSLWVIAAFLAGGFSGLLLGLGLWRNMRNRLRLHHLEAGMKKLQDENARLKQLQANKDKELTD